MAVVEVFSTPYLFLSGVFFLVSLVSIPCCCYIMGVLTYRYWLKRRKIRARGLERIMAYIFPAMFPWAFIITIKAFLSRFMDGYVLTPTSVLFRIGNLVYSSYSLLVLVFLLITAINDRKKRYIIFGFMLCVWGLMVFQSYSHELTVQDRKNVHSVYSINQDVISNGTITTERMICEESQRQEDGSYKTEGRLINKKDGIYYWQCDNEDTFLVPEENVLLYQVKH